MTVGLLLAAVLDLYVAGGTLDAVRTAVTARQEGKSVFLAAPRPYCGEDRAATLDLERHPEDDPDDPLVREIFNPAYRASGAYHVLKGKGWRAVEKFAPYETVATEPVTGALDTVTTPLLVKRACDRALLAAKVDFLTGAQTVAAERQTDGLWKVTYVTRSGETSVLAKAFVDRRVPRRIAKGRHRFAYRVVRGPKPHVETISFDFDVPSPDALGMLAVENHARGLVATSNLLDVAEWTVVVSEEPAERFGSSDLIQKTFDVAVAGGGTAGGPAAVAAARAGAKTVVIEYQNVLGGVASEGRIGGYGSYYDGNVCGFTKELENGDRSVGGVYFFARSEWLRREIVRAGGEVWLGTLVYGAVTDGNRLAGVKVAFPDGSPGIIRCRAAVDATGNSDLAAAAGAQTEFISADELSLQGCGHAGQPLDAACVNSDIGFVDETDAADLCFFALRSRLSLPDRIWNQSSLVDSRERRRIVGDCRITPIDLFLNRTYPDIICKARSAFDTHGQTSHPIFFVRDTGKRGDLVRANVPYRALLPRGVEGVIVTGLGVSAHRDAMPVLRMKADIQNQGYAAGYAAALAAKAGSTPRQIDVRSLQEHLIAVGNLPREVPPIPGYSDLPTNKERSDALRELCVARALYRLGDVNGLGQKSLRAYAADPRRAFANHAKQVLKGKMK